MLLPLLCVQTLSPEAQRVFPCWVRNHSSDIISSVTGSLKCCFLERVGCLDLWERKHAGVALAASVAVFILPVGGNTICQNTALACPGSCCADGAWNLSGPLVMDPSQGYHLLSQE